MSPTLTTVEFFVEGVPVPKGRPRMTKSGHTYTPQRTVAWENQVAWAARAAMRGQLPMLGPVAVRLDFYGARANADVDNLVKAVLDGMNLIVYKDDKQVDDLKTLRPTVVESRRGVQVRVEELP